MSGVIQLLKKLETAKGCFKIDLNKKKLDLVNKENFLQGILQDKLGIVGIEGLGKQLAKQGLRLVKSSKGKHSFTWEEQSDVKLMLQTLEGRQKDLANLCTKIITKAQGLITKRRQIWVLLKKTYEENERKMESSLTSALLRGVLPEKVKRLSDRLLEYFRVHAQQPSLQQTAITSRDPQLELDNADLIDDQDWMLDNNGGNEFVNSWVNLDFPIRNLLQRTIQL